MNDDNENIVHLPDRDPPPMAGEELARLYELLPLAHRQVISALVRYLVKGKQ